jgi:hypothetical protein
MAISPKRLEELENIPESAIDTSDRPESDASFWEKAKLVKPLTKQAISLRVDRDVLEGLRIVIILLFDRARCPMPVQYLSVINRTRSYHSLPELGGKRNLGNL